MAITTLFTPLFRLLRPRRTIRQCYDAAAVTWHSTVARLGYLDAYSLLTRHAMINAVRISASSDLTVLDAGVGSGAFSLSFARTWGRIPVVDILDVSPAMLRIAQSNLATNRIPARMLDGSVEVGIPDHLSYDVILCAHVVEHTPDPGRALARLRCALNPNGVLLLVASKPHWCTWILRWKWGHRAFTEGEMRQLLDCAGFWRVDTIAFAKGPPSRTSMGYIAFSSE
jgi:2-polyprenyl-3-methyl-5-hydroxy-6-metoxy-1,4-benzoquinol methylase